MTTPKPIDSLTPEELRVEIAEVQGAKWYTFASGQHWLSFKPLADHFKPSDRPRDMEMATIHEGVPNYPADANAALTLAHALVERGWSHSHHCCKINGLIFTFTRGIFTSEKHHATATGPHVFALALCRAYLAVVRAGKEQP